MENFEATPSPARASSQSDGPDLAADAAKRRGFLAGLFALVLGAIAGLTPLASGMVTFLDPIWRRNRRGNQGADGARLSIRLASLAAIPDDGLPHMFPVISDVIDAWTRLPQEKLGAVYVRREKGANTVQVFQAECPHAGCFVVFEGSSFKCPCHNSAFSATGERESIAGKENPAPRNLDTLSIDEEKLAATGEVWIQFQTFFTGREEKTPRV